MATQSLSIWCPIPVFVFIPGLNLDHLRVTIYVYVPRDCTVLTPEIRNPASTTTGNSAHVESCLFCGRGQYQHHFLSLHPRSSHRSSVEFLFSDENGAVGFIRRCSVIASQFGPQRPSLLHAPTDLLTRFHCVCFTCRVCRLLILTTLSKKHVFGKKCCLLNSS